MKDSGASWSVRRILVGIERDGLAEPARYQAMELSDLFDAELELVHAVPTGEPQRGLGRSAHWAVAAQRALDEARADIEGRLAISVEHPRWAALSTEDYVKVLAGRPAHVLLERARAFDADLLVFGPHRERGWLHLGGTARAVLGHAHVPVWLQPTPPGPLDRLLVPLDVSDASHRVLVVARALAEKLGASVTCLHVFAPPTFAFDPEVPGLEGSNYVIDEHRRDEFARFDELLAGFDWRGVKAERLTEEGEPTDRIVDHEGDDLIVMGTHGHTGLDRILGSVADGVLRRSRRPVLCVPAISHLG